MFNDQGYSDYFVVFLRLMVSCYLQENEDFFSAFIEGHTNMKDFCSQVIVKSIHFYNVYFSLNRYWNL